MPSSTYFEWSPRPKRIIASRETQSAPLPQVAHSAACRLFHSKHLMGPFSDQEGAYYLCEVGHRLPCDLFPAARPARKLRVWSADEEQDVSTGQTQSIAV